MAVAGEVGDEVGEEVGTVLGEGGEGMRGGKFETEGGAGHEGARGDDEEGEFGVFDGALEAIPEGGGHAAQVAQGGIAEVEHHESEVGVAGQEIGDGEGGGHITAAGPDEVFEMGGRMGLGVEVIEGIDEGGALTAGAGGGEQLAEQELGSAAGGGDEFGEGGEGESAAGGVVEGLQAGGQARAGGRPVGGRKALGEEMPERRQRGGRGRHG